MSLSQVPARANQTSGRRTPFALTLFSVILSVTLSAIAHAQTDLQGTPVVVDGDNVEVNNVRLSLHGVDAPTLNQQCSASGVDWSCGTQAALALRERIALGGGEISCRIMNPAAKPPRQAVCRQGDFVLNRWLVERGWALSGVDGEASLAAAMEQAMHAQVGIWRDGFQPSDAWKRLAGVALDDVYDGCSSCELRHRALADRQKTKQLNDSEDSD